MQALHDIGVPKEDVSVITLDHTVKGELSGSQVGEASDNSATGACIGTAVGGIWALTGSLVKMGVPHASAEAVDANLRAGAILLSVHEGAHTACRVFPFAVALERLIQVTGSPTEGGGGVTGSGATLVPIPVKVITDCSWLDR